MRTFDLVRREDVNGISGTGYVAEGCQFFDGTVAMRWCVPGKPHTTTIYGSILDLVDIHGHGGLTEVKWHVPITSQRDLS